jgi:hypothetical protein
MLVATLRRAGIAEFLTPPPPPTEINRRAAVSLTPPPPTIGRGPPSAQKIVYLRD